MREDDDELLEKAALHFLLLLSDLTGIKELHIPLLPYSFENWHSISSMKEFERRDMGWKCS